MSALDQNTSGLTIWYFCVARRVAWKTLEVIPRAASDTSQLTDRASSPVTPGDPRGSLLSAFLFAARRLRSHPRLGRARGPMPDLWGWREQLRVRGGTFQQLASRGRYVIKRIQCSSHRFLYWEPLPQRFFLRIEPFFFAVLISLVGGEGAV